jgi:hypothetical protein
MKPIALLLLVGGWAVAVGGLSATDDVMLRMALAVVGFATSLGGILTLVGAHNKDAIWKTKGAWR